MDKYLPDNHPIIKAMEKIVGGNSEYATWFSEAYGYPDDEAIDLQVRYHLESIKLWYNYSSEPHDGRLTGVLTFKIDGGKYGYSSTNSWEFFSDLETLDNTNYRELLLEEVADKIYVELINWFSALNVDIEFS